MKKIKHFLLTLAFLISFTSYSFSQEYESNKLFLKIKNNVEINLEKKNDKVWTSFLKKHNILEISKAFRSQEMHQYYLVETESNVNLNTIIEDFKTFSFVEFSERVPVYTFFFTPNDPQYNNQWNLAKIQADQAWNINQGSTAVKIAVIDDGFLLNHEDLASQWHINTNEIPNNNIDDDNNGYIDDWRGWDAADNDKDPSAFNPSNSYFTHGTHVAGIVAAATNNSLGIASIGYNCKLIPVKIGNDATSSLSGAYLGVEYAIVSGAQVMNMSWGGSGFSATYQALFNLAKSKGIVCVAAAGNSSTSMPMYPAAYNNVISVASSTSTDALSSFTNYGTTIDVTAPGSDILSTLAGGFSNYGIFSGTSMASPLVAGICGLMLSNNVGMHPDSVEACLERSCDNIDAQNPTKIGQFGAGRVNAFKALQCTQKAPISDFDVLDTFQCINTNVRFKSNSSGIQPLTYSWSFPGGNPSTSTLANPSVTYATAGTYSATLTVTNNFGTHSVSKTNIVRIGTPTAKLSGKKYTIYGTNAAILAINFIGTPPYNLTLTDGSNVWTQNNITSNPYFYSITPQKDTSLIQIQSFYDKNCVGIGSLNDTIIKLNASNYKMCRDSIEVTSAQNGWQALQPNNTWGSLSPCSFSSGVFNTNSSNISGITFNDCLWGPSNISSTRQIYTNWGQTNTSIVTLNIVKLRKDVNIPLNAYIDSIRIWSLVDDISDSIFFNNKLVHTSNIPIFYGHRVYSSVALNIGNVSTQNYFYLNEGDFGGSYGSYFKSKIYYSIPCETNSNNNKYCENSFSFNGSSSNVVKIEAQNGASWKDLYSTNGFTWECWFNLGNRNSNSFSNIESLISASDANLCEDIGLHFNWPSWPGVGKLNWVASGQTGCSAPTGVTSTNMTFNANTWYHAAGVMNYSTNTMQLYVNGNLVSTKSLTIPLSVRMQNNVAVTIGNQDVNYNPYSSFSPFKGKIDEVRFWNIPRTASDIQASYKNCIPASTPNLVAYFKGDEGNGTKTASIINSNFIGTLQNGASWGTQVDSIKNCTICNSINDCDTSSLNIGKVLHLDFNGNTQDKSGNNNHATNFGATPVVGKNGQANNAYRFDGINDYMKVNHHSSLSSSNLTLTALIKPNGFYNGTCYGNQIIKKGNTDFVNGEYGIIYSPSGYTNSCYVYNITHQNYAGFAFNNRPTSTINNTAPYVKTGQWDCLVYTKNSDSCKFYINGILKYTTSATNHGNNFDDLFLGKMDNPQYPYWLNADIDDIRIYNRALSASEVNGYCGTCNTSPPITIKCDTGKKYIINKCFNDSIQFNIGKGKNHQWSPAIELSNGSIQNPKCFAKNSMQYLVAYTDSLNCQIIDTFQINVFPSNKISLKDTMVCIGDSLFYSLENNGSSFSWLPNQYISSNNQQSTWIKPLTDITYFVSYKDQNGCNIKDTFDIKTKICCELKAIFEVSDSIICKSGLVTISNKSKNITNGIYNWTYTNILPSQYTGYSPPSIPLSQQGVYSIKLKTFNGICEDSMTRNIYVIDIKANAGKDSTFCTGTIANLKIGDSNTIADYKYSWTPTTGLDNANMASPTVNISQNIQYELSVYDPYTGCVALDTIFLGINNNLDTFKYIDTLCDGDTKVFFGQNITISGIYQHYVKDKLNCDKEVHILSIFFRKPNLSNSIQKACNFYTDKNGVKHTDSFEYKDSTYINGCLTNIHTTKIKILKTRYEEIDMTGCYKMNWKGKTYIDTIKKIDSFTFKDNGCDTLIQYVNLNVVKKAEIKINSTHSNPINYGEEIILQAFGSNNYKWNTGDIGFQLSHTATKDYQFYVVGYNNVLCPDTAYYNIILSTQSAIELPEIFSPNDDGKNDLFKPNYKGNVQLLDLIIFNRWGEKMFEGHGNEAYWNGKYKGEYQSPGGYIYLFRYILNGNEVSKKGSFVLVR